MDGGNHDSVSHGIDHGGHDHGGHDHGHHGVHHGHGQGGHSLIAQILGLDQQDHAHLAHHGGEGGEGLAPSQSASWNSALQGLKLENLMAGINITPNFLLFMLFASFVGWLGVVYWIRHHEPFANQVLGSSAAYAPTAGQDRILINGARQALPLKTGPKSGMVYCPQPGQNTGTPQVQPQLQPRLQASAPAPAGSQVNNSLSQAMSAAFTSAAPAAPVQAQPQEMSQMASPMGEMAAPMGQMAAPMASPMGGLSGSARLFSSRGGMGANAQMMGQVMGQQMGAPSGARLYSNRRGMLAQSQGGPPPQAAAPMAPMAPAAPVADPNVWSLATQGNNSFSSDTAQFNSQFGEPLTNTVAPLPSLPAGAYPVSTSGGTRLKLVTDK